MGTCFTRTHHISGRQPKSEYSTRRQNTENSSSPRRSTNSTNKLAHKHGSSGIQSSYNRYICGRQKTCGPSSDPRRKFDVSTGNINFLHIRN